jgi:hypothetical protein
VVGSSIVVEDVCLTAVTEDQARDVRKMMTLQLDT